MRKYRGSLLEVSSVEPTPGRLGGWMIERIRVGATTLKNVNCDDIVARQLRADEKREACLYVINLPIGTLPFPLNPNLLGVKYADFIAGAIAATVLGFLGVENRMLLSSIPGLAFVGGLILAWWCSLRLGFDYVRARMD
jgi:hypothetical protein